MRSRFIELFAILGRRTALPLITATLIAGMTGMRAYPRHSHNASQPASSDPAWSELQHSVESMHEALFSLNSTGNNDEDFVRLMLPHHQAAIDMAKAELMHGQDHKDSRKKLLPTRNRKSSLCSFGVGSTTLKNQSPLLQR